MIYLYWSNIFRNTTNMKKALLLLLHFCIITTYAQTHQIGHKQQTFVDTSRSNREITAEIYYPATTTGDDVAIASGEFPVLVFGHGFVMTWSAYAPVWNALVPNGYIMVFPTTESSIFPSHSNFGKDIAYLVGAMKNEGTSNSSAFFGAVDGTSAVMGHSMGGGAAFLAVQYDPTITALATLAAANTNPPSITAAAEITIPSIVLAGANDCVAPPDEHQLPMYDALAADCKTLVSITGGSHCQFANTNTNCFIGELTCTPRPAINADAQQATTYQLLLPWLDYYLKYDTVAGTQFQDLITTGNGIESQQNCSLLSTYDVAPAAVSKLNIFPNPLFETTTLETNVGLINASLVIYNIYGQAVFEQHKINSQIIVLSRNNLASGLYFVRLSDGTKTIAVEKLLIAD